MDRHGVEPCIENFLIARYAVKLHSSWILLESDSHYAMPLAPSRTLLTSKRLPFPPLSIRSYTATVLPIGPFACTVLTTISYGFVDIANHKNTLSINHLLPDAYPVLLTGSMYSLIYFHSVSEYPEYDFSLDSSYLFRLSFLNRFEVSYLLFHLDGMIKYLSNNVKKRKKRDRFRPRIPVPYLSVLTAYTITQVECVILCHF